MSWDLGHEANPKSGKGHSKNGGPNGNAPKVGKLFEKNIPEAPLQRAGR